MRMASMLTTLQPLIEALRAEEYAVVGPKVSGEAIVLAELESAAELPVGWGVDLSPEGYRLRRRADGRRSAIAPGQDPGNPTRIRRGLQLFTTRRDPDGFSVEEPPDEPRKLAFLGVRPCDPRAAV
jgi:hypothetical protein